MLDIDSAIKARAYEIWQARGERPGHDLDDWLRAEAEITAALSPAAISPRSTPPKPKSAAKATPQSNLKTNLKARPKTRTRTGAKA